MATLPARAQAAQQNVEMRPAEGYRLFAQKCLDMANSAAHDDKVALLEIAQAWMTLAVKAQESPNTNGT
jgi:hypothetical protein